MHQKTFHLRLGQRIRAFLLDGILRGHDQEPIGHFVRLAGDCHLPLLHRLQECRLHLRGCTVDFVGEDQVAEDGAGLKPKLALSLGGVIHRGAGDITRQ